MTFVPYPGTAPAFDAVLGQHVTAYLGESSLVVTQVKAGMLRPLAVASARRLESLPDVPTLAELGLPDVLGELWLGIWAPAKTPKVITEKLASSYAAALQLAEIKAKFAELGLYPASLCGADFAAFVREQFDDYRRIIGEVGIKVD